MRGNHGVPAGKATALRSIPACAGEPVDDAAVSARAAVYPRVCGGTASSISFATCVMGLSPRVRGNHFVTVYTIHRRRSIPACAGEPYRCIVYRRRTRVYPRVCGGTCARTRQDVGQAGLSPRVRGTFLPHPQRLPQYGLSPRVRGNLFFGVHRDHSRRSIPACAGEPFHLMASRSAGAVYPRVCGGTLFTATIVPLGAGLSPRVRGNRRVSTPPGQIRRSIPACAGEPHVAGVALAIVAVYPRVCGGTPCNRYASLPSHKPKLYLTTQQTVFLASPVLRRSSLVSRI